MFGLAFSTFQFLVFHGLVRVVDRVSRLPRGGVQPEVERLLRENLALKAQVRALVLELKRERGSRPKVSLRTRAAQVFAYLLTRGDKAFQNYYLSASRTTIERWATKLRRGPWPWRRRGKGGRPPLAQEVKDLIIKLKKENPLYVKHSFMWSQPDFAAGRSRSTEDFCSAGDERLHISSWRSHVVEPLDDVLSTVPGAVSARLGDWRLAALEGLALHGHVDLDVLAGRGDAHVAEP